MNTPLDEFRRRRQLLGTQLEASQRKGCLSVIAVVAGVGWLVSRLA